MGNAQSRHRALRLTTFGVSCCQAPIGPSLRLADASG